MTTYEERRELMEMAEAVRQELRGVTLRVHMLINKILSEGDTLKLQAADEVSAGTSVTKKQVIYGKVTAAVEKSLGVKLPEVRQQGQQVLVTSGGIIRRACSLCREPGHRAKNCPNAHVVQEQKKAAVAAREVKPKRKSVPMTAERKAKLIETLKKARAPKKGK